MTASTWTRVYRRPDGGLELWELRHRSGALLAEMSLWQVNRTRWYCDHRDVLLLLEAPFAVTRAIVQHRRELRALRAQIHARVADFDAQEEPPSTEASTASFAEENAERIGRVQSLRQRRRERREARARPHASERRRCARAHVGRDHDGRGDAHGAVSPLAPGGARAIPPGESGIPLPHRLTGPAGYGCEALLRRCSLPLRFPLVCV
jgi:hypothetical protein